MSVEVKETFMVVVDGKRVTLEKWKCPFNCQFHPPTYAYWVWHMEHKHNWAKERGWLK